MGNKKRMDMTVRKRGADVYRVRLIDGWSTLWTFLIVIGLLGALVGVYLLGWLDLPIAGTLILVVLGVLLVAMVSDLGLLLTACMTIADGMINAGKDEQGNQLLFHTENIVEIQLRDKKDEIVEENKSRYRNVSVTFVMASGRINRRARRNYTQKQIDRIRAAVREHG